MQRKNIIFSSLRLHFEKKGCVGERVRSLACSLNCVSRELHRSACLVTRETHRAAQPTPAAADVMQTAEQCTATGCISAVPQGQSTLWQVTGGWLAGWQTTLVRPPEGGCVAQKRHSRLLRSLGWETHTDRRRRAHWLHSHALRCYWIYVRVIWERVLRPTVRPRKVV